MGEVAVVLLYINFMFLAMSGLLLAASISKYTHATRTLKEARALAIRQLMRGKR